MSFEIGSLSTLDSAKSMQRICFFFLASLDENLTVHDFEQQSHVRCFLKLVTVIEKLPI